MADGNSLLGEIGPPSPANRPVSSGRSCFDYRGDDCLIWKFSRRDGYRCDQGSWPDEGGASAADLLEHEHGPKPSPKDQWRIHV